MLAKNPNIKILSDDQDGKGNREGGMNVMQGHLTRYADIDAVFTINDPQAIGSDLAAKQLGRSGIVITSVDGAPDIEGALAGNTLVEASASQDPWAMAQKAVEVGYEIMNGKKPAEPMILMPSSLITARQRRATTRAGPRRADAIARRRPAVPGRRRPLACQGARAMADVVCFGDLLIDFVPTVTGTGLADAPAFVKAPGGAAANVAVGLARLGVASAFMGKVGDDPFGHFLADTLRGRGRRRRAACASSRAARTALAFVSLRADGEREFLFYRHPSADMLFTPDEVDAGSDPRPPRVFHFDSISLAAEQPRATALHAAALAAGAPAS